MYKVKAMKRPPEWESEEPGGRVLCSPELWLHRHQDLCFCTGYAALRQSAVWRGQDCWPVGPPLWAAGRTCDVYPDLGLRPLRQVPHPDSSRGQALTALLLVTLVEAVGQPITLPGARDAPPVAAHEVPRDVALVGEVVPREQLALCRREGTGRSEGTAQAARTRAPHLKGLLFGMSCIGEASGR